MYLNLNSSPLKCFSGMNTPFILNDAAKNDAAVQLAMQSYMNRLQKQEQQRQQIRDGLITPSPFTIVDISDRH